MGDHLLARSLALARENRATRSHGLSRGGCFLDFTSCYLPSPHTWKSAGGLVIGKQFLPLTTSFAPPMHTMQKYIRQRTRAPTHKTLRKPLLRFPDWSRRRRDDSLGWRVFRFRRRHTHAATAS